MPFHFLDGKTITETLPMSDCIDVMSDAMMAVHKGKTVIPLRQFVSLPEAGTILGSMPGAMTDPAVSGAKLITLYPDNPAQGLAAIQGVIILFDLNNGAPIALLDAQTITAMRTAAASGAATRLLARKDARTLALFGYGVQAASHLEAMLAVRDIDRVLVWGRSVERAQDFAQSMRTRFDIDVQATAQAQRAAEQADIICTLTASPTPVIEGQWLKAGAHINLVGAHTPTNREIDSEGIKKSRLYVEIKEFALKEAGDILIPLQEGAISEDHIVGEIGSVLAGDAPGRANDDEVTIYKSLGNVAQDLAAAYAVFERAKEAGKSQCVDFGQDI